MLTRSSKWVGLEVLAICAWKTTLHDDLRIRGRVTSTSYHLSARPSSSPFSSSSSWTRCIRGPFFTRPLRSGNPIHIKRRHHGTNEQIQDLTDSTGVSFGAYNGYNAAGEWNPLMFWWAAGAMETRRSLRCVTLVHPLLQLTAPGLSLERQRWWDVGSWGRWAEVFILFVVSRTRKGSKRSKKFTAYDENRGNMSDGCSQDLSLKSSP